MKTVVNQNWNRIIVVALVAFLIASLYWGTMQQRSNMRMMVRAENQYQRSFHNLTTQMYQLHEQLGKTLALHESSLQQQRKGLLQIWQLTSQAQTEITQLPVTWLPFLRTEQFLTKIANFSYKASVRDLTKQPLSQKEVAVLNHLYENSAELTDQFAFIQTKVMEGQLRWTDVEDSIVQNAKGGGQSIADGFRNVDETVGAYRELDWGTPVTNMYTSKATNDLPGDMITAEQVREKVLQFVNIDPQQQLLVTENGKGTAFETYAAVIQNRRNQPQLQFDFAKKGGHLLLYMNNRSIGAKTATVEQARQQAMTFLEQHQFKNMQIVNYDVWQNQVIFTAVQQHNQMLIYPESIIVKVALDRAEVIGLQATDYVFGQHERHFSKPTLSSTEARKRLHVHFKRESERLAVIKNENGDEVVCYQFIGTLNDGRYRIFINADTGEEEQVDLLAKLTE